VNDLYVYKLLESAWALCPANGNPPGEMLNPTIALWEAAYQLFAFGGVDNSLNAPVTLYSYTVTDDTIVNGEISGSWAQVTYGGSTPTGRSGHTAVFNQATSTMLVYGGLDYLAFSVRDDLWAYDASAQTWALLSPGGTAPTGRHSHAAAWAEAQQKMFISAGVTLSGFSSQLLSDLFCYDVSSNTWTELTALSSPTLNPPSRWSHSMVWLPSSEKLLVYGGKTGSGSSSDVGTSTLYGFTLSNQVWEELSYTGTISASDEHAAVWYDGAYETTGDWEWNGHEAMVLFGGYDTSGDLIGDLTHMWFKPATTTSATSTLSTTTATSSTATTQTTSITSATPPTCFHGPNCFNPHFEVVEASALPGVRWEPRAALHVSLVNWYIFGGSTSSGYENDLYVIKCWITHGRFARRTEISQKLCTKAPWSCGRHNTSYSFSAA
jgi:hypothetical protein